MKVRSCRCAVRSRRGGSLGRLGNPCVLREPKTDIPGLVLNMVGNARIAYLPADIDRRYAKNYLLDQGNLLANIVRWAAADAYGFELQGPGLIDCHVYRQPGRMIVHLINLTNAGVSRAPLEEFLPVGPLKLNMNLAEDVRGAPRRRVLGFRGESRDHSAPELGQCGDWFDSRSRRFW